jgi:Ferredoxin-like domain in Api92-like protein
MPNWCVNELTITGKTKDLDAFAAVIEIKEDGTYKGLKDTFLPTPRELSFHTGGTTIDGKQCDAWYEHDLNGTIVRTPVTDREKKRFKKQYGADNWYDWCLVNWGAKWGDHDGCAKRRAKSVWLEFDTPWGPPEQGIETISGRFPTLTFTLRYWERGMGFQGKTVCKAGAIASESHRKYYGPRGG